MQLLEPVAALSTISDREALLLDIPPAWYDRVEHCLDRSVATLNELRSVWQQYRREASDLLQGTQAQTGLVPEVPAEPQRRSQPVPAPRVHVWHLVCFALKAELSIVY